MANHSRNLAGGTKIVVVGALGECVHVAGVTNFLRLAETAGWRTIFLGLAVPIERVLSVARSENADMVGVSYRLTPDTGERLLAEFAEAADDLHAAGVRFAFVGTPPVAARARALGFSSAYSSAGSRPTRYWHTLKARWLPQRAKTTSRSELWRGSRGRLRFH